ncbi:acyl carrier protein [Chlorogloea sp. CCALA 695]|uniref:acyl carrier protein n=1 Tax=Chlorogloea sp. CCALA 695 TaxID=2107693 RepID=UPI000D06816B|nr:acyl carrier protein [Chlorogloea sp. CCALA 695]PSB32724.1 acyl carrier protein [Chlorogloea sp. CCALA 695]
MSVLNTESIQVKVIAVLQDMIADWELDDINEIDAETKLMEDFAFESLEVVQFVVCLGKEFERRNLPFQNLFKHDGDYVDKIKVKEVVGFLNKNISI